MNSTHIFRTYLSSYFSAFILSIHSLKILTWHLHLSFSSSNFICHSQYSFLLNVHLLLTFLTHIFPFTFHCTFLGRIFVSCFSNSRLPFDLYPVTFTSHFSALAWLFPRLLSCPRLGTMRPLARAWDSLAARRSAQCVHWRHVASSLLKSDERAEKENN